MWNRERRFQGQTDVPLSAEGRAQALALARELSGIAFDLAVSSDLSRAMETARAIYGPDVHPDPRWREFEFGEWEGLTWDEIVARWPEYGDRTDTAAKRYAPPGGESFDAVAVRVACALDELRGGGHAHALVVTHAGPLHAMLHTLFGELPVRFAPASVTRVRFEAERPELTLLNDVAHL